MSGYDEPQAEDNSDAEAFRAVTDTPEPDYIATGGSPLGAEQIERLKAPLDEARIRRRDGRGGGKFEYVAIHDAIRTANAIFGFGAWGHEVVEQERIGEVEVVSKGDKPGYHVAYRTVVRLTVKGCVPVSGTGYGDGVEYGGEAARLTASELALKESESDALKRALVKYGDQFGLILYAKVDEKRRIESDRRSAESESSGPPLRRDQQIPLPKNWADVQQRLNAIDVELGWDLWLNQASVAQFGKALGELPSEVRRFEAFQRAQATVVKIEEGMKGGDFPPPSRAEIQAAFAHAWDGAVLEGPSYRLSPDETDRPTREEVGGGGTRETGSDAAGEAALTASPDEAAEVEGDAEARQTAAEEKAAEAALTGPPK